MKKTLFFTFILFAFIFVACGQKHSSKFIAPFTDITWENSLEQICVFEGNDYERSLSMAGGYNYIFPKQYLNYDGYIQYNIDDTGTLSGVSWFYIGNDTKITEELYLAIQKDTIANLGSEEPLDDSNIYSGNKWETPDSTVILVSFSQNNEHAVQISYLLKDK